MTAKSTILVVEDDANDQALIEMAFRQNGATQSIQFLDGGGKAIAYLRGDGEYSDRQRFPYPALIMTDLKMPNGDGFSVMEHLRSARNGALTPKVVLSASDDRDDVESAYLLGANSYLVKPSGHGELRKMLQILVDYWMWCQVPDLDQTGKGIKIHGKGKLGGRFGESD